MNVQEIRLRRLAGQRLIVPTDKLTAARELCGVQAQFMSNARHSLKIRAKDYDKASFSDGLVKNWTIRGTVHVFARSDLPLFICCGEKYRINSWEVPSFWNQRAVWSLTPSRQQYFSQIILEALEERPRTREALKDICRVKGMTESEESSMFDPWGGGIRELCERGFMNYTVGEEKAFELSPPFEPMPREEAELEMARRYFTHMGPATVHDAMYYFHAPAKRVKEWLDRLPVSSVQCEGRTYFYIEPGIESASMPKCLFLAGFDQLMLAYEKKESLFLAPEHMRSVFNLAGIVMPTVMLDGAVVGRWKKKGGRLTVELFDGISQCDMTAIQNKAHELWEDITRLDVIPKQ